MKKLVWISLLYWYQSIILLIMFAREFTVLIFLLVTQQCVMGGIMVGDSNLELQLSAEAVAELGTTENPSPRVITEQPNDDLYSSELPKDASVSTTPLISSCKTISVRSESSERIRVCDLLPPPSPELDGLLKPPEYTQFRSVFSFLV
ncbi:MAG: hypothetical protein GY904_35750 [Planctomycetaceae bacterium]|nr:hypothetical protein [Planctomycetaceae bacterium]